MFSFVYRSTVTLVREWLQTNQPLEHFQTLPSTFTKLKTIKAMEKMPTAFTTQFEHIDCNHRSESSLRHRTSFNGRPFFTWQYQRMMKKHNVIYTLALCKCLNSSHSGKQATAVVTFGSANDSSSPLSADYIRNLYAQIHEKQWRTELVRECVRTASNMRSMVDVKCCNAWLVARGVAHAVKWLWVSFGNRKIASTSLDFCFIFCVLALLGGLVRHGGGGGTRGPTVNNIRIYKSHIGHGTRVIISKRATTPQPHAERYELNQFRSVYNNHRRWIDSLANIRMCDGAGVALWTPVIATYAVVYY